MTTRYNLQITFGGVESEAPEDWEVYSINAIAASMGVGNTSGEVAVYQDDELRRVFWTLEAEDE